MNTGADMRIFYDGYLIGKYGIPLVLAALYWLWRRPWFPHKHSGYVSITGRVVPCRHCGKLPPNAYRAGMNGMIGPDGYDDEGYDASGFNRDGVNRDGRTRREADLLREAHRLAGNYYRKNQS